MDSYYLEFYTQPTPKGMSILENVRQPARKVGFFRSINITATD